MHRYSPNWVCRWR